MNPQVYAIQCEDGSLYIGHTTDLEQRWQAHKAGRVRWTSSRRPLSLVYQEPCTTLETAVERERALKAGCGREWLKSYLGGRPACRQAGKTVGAGVITEIVK